MCPCSWVSNCLHLNQVNTCVFSKASICDRLLTDVYSLWGNPSHLQYLKTTLQDAYSDLHILVSESNANSFTYDGIELGGERTANEIERKIEELQDSGHEIKKISVIGYSLGGLVARYAIGLLYSNKVFEKIQPVVCRPYPTQERTFLICSRISPRSLRRISESEPLVQLLTPTCGMY